MLDTVAGVAPQLTGAIRTDQGPEFAVRALDQCAYGYGVQLKLIAPGKLTQKVFIEGVNAATKPDV